MREVSKTVHLPFAGITLFRFNGYYLSLPLMGKHPEECSAAKIVFFEIVWGM